MKKFIRIEQTFYTIAIMDVEDDESISHIKERVKSHLDRNGADNVINQGGDIKCSIVKRINPSDDDSDTYECID